MFTYEKSKWITEDEKIKVGSSSHNRNIKAHRHQFIELVYIKSGTGIEKIDEQEYRVSHGSLLFINYGQVHSFIPDKESIECINVLITPQFLSEELIDGESITNIFAHSMFAEFTQKDTIATQCITFTGEELKRIDDLIYIMEKEYYEKKQGYKSALHGYVRVLFTYMLRKLHNNEIIINDIMPDILKYISTHVSEKLTLSEIAAKSFYNPTYFSKLLKKNFGKSFSAYIKELRMEKAVQILKESNENIETVMRQCGYADKKLFYTHFKESFGVTPGKFRKIM